MESSSATSRSRPTASTLQYDLPLRFFRGRRTDFVQNLINAVAFISPAVYLYYFYLNPTADSSATWLSPAKSMSYRFNPLEIVVYLVGYMFMQ